MSENQQLLAQEQEEGEEEEEGSPVERPFNLGRSTKLGFTTLIISLTLDFLLNGSFTNLGGQTGLWLAAIAAIAAFLEANPIVEQMQELAPVRALSARKREVPKTQLPFWKRAFGIAEEESLPIDTDLDEPRLAFLEEEDDEDSEPSPFPLLIPAAAPLPRPELAERESGDHRHVVDIRCADRGREILLAENLGLDIDEVIDAGVFVAGMKGSGKSSLAARLMEQVGRFPTIPQVIFDIKGDFVSLVDSHFQHGVIAGRGRLYDPSTILSRRLQVVVDLRAFTMEERGQLIARICHNLLKEAMALPEEARFPWFVHVDETQQYASQQKPDGIFPETWRAVVSSLMNLGVLGRAYGAVPCLYTQRIADIHKSVISQQELRVFMKASMDTDLKRYRDYINAATVSDDAIRAFRAGDSVVILPDGRQLLRHFLPRESKHSSHTPHLEQALRFPPGSQPFPRFPDDGNGNPAGNGRETALEAIEQRFPPGGNAPGNAPAQDDAEVGNALRETIRRMHQRGYPHREIAALVGLSGRKYSLYRQACTQMGIPLE